MSTTPTLQWSMAPLPMQKRTCVVPLTTLFASSALEMLGNDRPVLCAMLRDQIHDPLVLLSTPSSITYFIKNITELISISLKLVKQQAR